MPDESDTQLTPFGSAYRRGRDDPRYQLGRLRMLCTCWARVADPSARHLRHQHRRARQVWDAKDWQEQQARKLQNQITELDKVVEEQRAWIAKLEETHAGATRELKDWIGQIEEAKAYHEATTEEQADWIKQLEEAKADLAGQLEVEKVRHRKIESMINHVRKRWLGRWLIRLVRWNVARKEHGEQLRGRARKTDQRDTLIDD